jgi:hypothetical protein
MWHFHEEYKALDIEDVYWYSNKFLMDCLESIPKFDGDPSLALAHIVMFNQLILDFDCDQDDVIIRLFLFSLEENQRD